MAKLLTGSQVNSELERILTDAREHIVIVSPYIKLHQRVIRILKAKQEEPKLAIDIVFGKNENEISKSVNKDDIEFLKSLPNISISHEPNLHAKYYANESVSMLSSMNLYDFSQNNNIEFGVLATTSLVGSIVPMGDLDTEAFKYFNEVVRASNLLYRNEPKFGGGIAGIGKKYTGSEVTVDKITALLETKPRTKKSTNKPSGIVDYITSDDSAPGYCIRTGEKIPFNPERPFSNSAFKQWSKFGNEEYPEKYCHFSGESSDGETSFIRPILRKNWKKAKELIK